MSQPKLLEGVFAINKPPAITSAQVLRDMQKYFNPSTLFAPWLAAETVRRDRESHNQRQRRSRRQRGPPEVKIGHGGTLDPLATGILITGIGSGTKSLQGFLECTKSYDCVVLFGAATDTYDTEGKVVARAPYHHIKKERVEEALDKFRGKIMQRPPIYSALRVQGKKLYEYAREGKEVPVEIKERPVEVKALELTEWMEGGTHEWDWPDQVAEQKEKELVGELLHLGDNAERNSDEISGKRKRSEEATEDVHGTVTGAEPPSPKKSRSGNERPASEDLPPKVEQDAPHLAVPSTPLPVSMPASTCIAPERATTPVRGPSAGHCPAPAARIRMTVASGFYVRSLCHDLGAAVGSLGMMTKLVRTRQGDFELGKNVLEYEDLAGGEEIWGPKVKTMLEDWTQRQGATRETSNTMRKDCGERNERPIARSVRRNSSSSEGKY
ncbi:pseudouridine synthase pus4 [Elasticomyces elasticus]|nr:pseudouridine synthase pus4 [Elasticomyces elasticus]